VPGLNRSFTNLNKGLNALAYNPSGAAEGFMFYLPWLNHNVNNLFLLQDAHGPLRRGIVMQTCETARFSEGVATGKPFILTLLETTNQPRTTEIC
jgi:phospholipid/cholesterol/gamma-HCH transport system substrate-binding protein